MSSKDISQTCNRVMEVKHYFMATESLTVYLREMFKVSFPDYYVKYQHAFGHWFGQLD